MSIRFLVTLVSLALLLAPASASTLEEATNGFVSYQFDGTSSHDAPDSCPQADAEWSATPLGSTDGVLVAPDDVADVFVLDVPDDLRGKRLHLDLAEPTGDVEALHLATFAPGCSGTVLDPVNWPTPEPSPPAPAEGERQASAGSQPRICFEREWVFVADQMHGFTPAPTIHVAWTDGSELSVPLVRDAGGSPAVYTTDHDLGITLKGAWINMPASWPGEFFLAAGPCATTDGGAVYGEPPVAGMGFLEFTPVRSGPFVVQVTYAGEGSDLLAPVPAPGTVDPAPLLPFTPSDLAHDLEHDPVGTVGGSLGGLPVASLSVDTDPSDGVRLQPPAPLVMPRSCHTCVGNLEQAVKEISYRLLGSLAG